MLGSEVCLFSRATKPEPQFTVAWAYPNTYEIGMASLGYQLVWGLIEADPDTYVCRAFSNCAENVPGESELIGFTLSWELDFLNILSMLKSYGVDCLSSQRREDAPLVFGGGPVLSANPEPFADFFDVILLGDAEVTVPKFLSVWKEVRKFAKREEKLLAFAQAGFYVPSLYSYQMSGEAIAKISPVLDVVPATIAKSIFDPPADYICHSLMLAPDTTWGDLFCVEVVRSCPQECRFCLASYLTRPFRAASVETLLAKIDMAAKYTKNIGLLGPSVTEHPQFDSLAEGLMARENLRVSLASVRADSLNATICNMVKARGGKSITIAIESGSERLRAIMKKNLSEAEIFQAVELIDAAGLKGVKFYGMVGLPGEEDCDLDETIRLMTALKKKHKRLHFVFGVSSFVPKAQTPFQWSGRDRASGDKLEYIRKNLSCLGIEVRAESHNWSDIQALLSRGDRRLTPLLLELSESKGNIGAWKKAMRNMPDGAPQADSYIYRDIPFEETLPWSHLVEAAKVGMLTRQAQSAQSLAGKPQEIIAAPK